MTKIQATVVADSLSPQGHRLISLLCTFPKYLLAEAKTHRVISQDSNEVEIQDLDVSFNADKNLSRNSASSRAIPTHRLLEQVKNNPFIPIAWMKEHKGMQGKEYIVEQIVIDDNIKTWKSARDQAIFWGDQLVRNEVTKQIANRLLEPFLWTTVIVSATEWENFLELRCPDYCTNGRDHYRSRKDYIKAQPEELKGAFELMDDISWLMNNKGQAEIHIMALAEAIWDAINESKPKQLRAGEWHIPFREQMSLEELFKLNTKDNDLDTIGVKIATAMAARTSYTVVGDEKEISYERLIAIHDRLIEAKPLHASPMEHCARAMNDDEYKQFQKTTPTKAPGMWSEIEEGWCRNFRGFIQYRHMIESGSINY